MTPIQNKTYQHRYGGIYIVDDVATHTETKERLVIYSHVYPFENNTWARPIEQWTSERFKELSPEKLKEFLAKDRQVFQDEINFARNTAKKDK